MTTLDQFNTAAPLKGSPTCEEEGTHPSQVRAAREAMPEQRDIQRASELLKAIGYPVRMNILSALSAGELCVCDMQEILGMSQSAVSHQLRNLRAANLVKHRRGGKQVYYSLADGHVHKLLQMTLEHVSHD